MKTINRASGKVACNRNDYPTKAATIWELSKNNKTKKEFKAGKQIWEQVRYPAVSRKRTQEAAQTPARNDSKNVDWTE